MARKSKLPLVGSNVFTWKDGHRAELALHIDFDAVMRALSARARRSKSGVAKALDGSIELVHTEVKS